MTRKKFNTVIILLWVVMLFLTACGNSAPENMVEVKKGTFIMGNTRNDETYSNEENTLHEVELTYDYYMGKYEVTFGDFVEFLNSVGVKENCRLNGNTVLDLHSLSTIEYLFFEDKFALKERSGNYLNDEGYSEYPVERATWWGAIEYCNWLSRKENLKEAYDTEGNFLDSAGKITDDITKVEGYRLPTEAEWEYAARGGHKSTEDYKYAGSNNADEVAWYKENTEKPQKPGLKKPNELDLYDMSGNMLEWCHDNKRVYPDWKLTNPIGPSSSPYRILRGGKWYDSENYLRITYRQRLEPFFGEFHIGFRIAKTK